MSGKDRIEKVLNLYDYRDKSKIRLALRNMLQLQISAESGDTASHSVWMDMQKALGEYKTNQLFSAVTKKQKQAILYHFRYDYSIVEIACKLNISQQAVSARIACGIDRIQRFLLDGEVKWTDWTDEEVDLLIDNYVEKGASWCSERLQTRSIQQIYSKVKELRELGLIKTGGNNDGK